MIFSQVSNGQNEHKYEEKSSEEKFEPASDESMDADNDPRTLTSSCTMQENVQKRPLEKGPVGKKDFLKKAKGKKGQPMADDNDPQPSSCNGTAHQNGQEKPAKKAKLEKGYPKAANKDPPLPSPINSTDQQNGQEKPARGQFEKRPT